MIQYVHMKQKTILCCDIDSTEQVYLEPFLKRLKLEASFCRQPLSSKIARQHSATEILVCFINSQVTAEILQQLPNLKLITTMSTGYDHIDLEYCRTHNISVTNVPTYGVATVAEHTFALLLALTRKVPQSVINTRAGSFSLNGLEGIDLEGKTLGIIGFGKIGQHVARIAYGFGLRVIAYDMYKDKVTARKLSTDYVSLKSLLKQSDIISLHAPLTNTNHHLLNQRTFKLIKPTAYLINTARGELIDSSALLKAMQENRLAGAGLDVLEDECVIQEEPELLKLKSCPIPSLQAVKQLLKHPKVIVTPHNAFNTREANERILQTTIENIKNFLKNNPINIVS